MRVGAAEPICHGDVEQRRRTQQAKQTPASGVDLRSFAGRLQVVEAQKIAALIHLRDQADLLGELTDLGEMFIAGFEQSGVFQMSGRHDGLGSSQQRHHD